MRQLLGAGHQGDGAAGQHEDVGAARVDEAVPVAIVDQDAAAWAWAETSSWTATDSARGADWRGRGAVPWPAVFKSTTGGSVFRIPCLLWAPAPGAPLGVLLAFAEHRLTGVEDWGHIELVARSSVDLGRTWSPARSLFSPEDLGMPDEVLTMGNPTAVFAADPSGATGRVVLLFTVQFGSDPEVSIWAQTSRGSRWPFVTESSDGGETWSRPRNITLDAKRPSWTWYATGPGAAIQLARGPHAGRLLAPCDHVKTGKGDKRLLRSHIIYSDDLGATWHLGAEGPLGSNECAVAELSNGSVLLNSRDWPVGVNHRFLSVSNDGGETFTGESVKDSRLIEPHPHGCQAAMLSIELPGTGSRVLFFSNPAAETRRGLLLRASQSEGAAWEHEVLLHAGFSAYSALTVAAPVGASARVLCLFEMGNAGAYERLALAVMSAALPQASPALDV